MNFKKDFPETQIIKIEQNYRSVQPILEVANQIIQHNKQRNPKHLWSDRPAKDRVRVISCMSNYQEGDTIAQLISVASREKSRPTIAILYRAHFQSRTVEEALIKNSIPYKIIGGTQFYDRKEIKDLLAYLRLIINPFDRAAFFRVINCPSRGLGEKFEELFYERWNADPFSSYDVIIRALIEEKSVTGIKKTALEPFANTFKNLNYETRPLKALEYIIAHVAYITYLKTTFDSQEAQTRIDNVKELLRAITHFESNGVITIRALLDEITLMQEHIQNDEEQDPVLLMTLHAAKGLEFDMVILCGLEEGLFPSSRSLMTDDGLEEERRLFYVGITRAKERLLITYARHRYSYGQMNDQVPSRFIQEIPQKLASAFEGSSWNVTQAKTFFVDWLKAKNPNTVLTFGVSQSVPAHSSPKIAAKHLTKEPTKARPKTVTQKIKEAVTQRYAASKKTPAAEPVKSTTNPGHGSPEVEAKNRTTNGWRTNQPVSHKSFGVGVIKNIETRSDDQVFLTVQFKSGTKKIEQKFLAKV